MREKDKKAIALLYDLYAPALFGVVLKIVRSEQTAEDVLQDVFVKIWKNSAHYNPGKGRLFTWLLNIARNTAIDKVRSAPFRQSEKNQTLDSSVHNYKSQSLNLNTEQIGLRELVEGLDGKYQEIIDLIYFQGFTQKEVMETLNIPLGTVKSRIRIALRELRKFFETHKIVLTTIFWLFITAG